MRAAGGCALSAARYSGTSGIAGAPPPVMDQNSLMMPHQCDAMSGEPVSIQHACTLLHLLQQFDRHASGLCAQHTLLRAAAARAVRLQPETAHVSTQCLPSLPFLHS